MCVSEHDDDVNTIPQSELIRIWMWRETHVRDQHVLLLVCCERDTERVPWGMDAESQNQRTIEKAGPPDWAWEAASPAARSFSLLVGLG